jgi:hypothetical protein
MMDIPSSARTASPPTKKASDIGQPSENVLLARIPGATIRTPPPVVRE